jgi:benzoate/toluate 1,2-dioxygenase beta subunit
MTQAAVALESATRLVLCEARLLDERRHDEWLALYSADATYWIPARSDTGGFAPDNPSALSMLRMDRALLADWVARMKSGFAHVESPPVDTTRLVSAVEPDEQDANVFHAAWMMQTYVDGRSDLHSGRTRYFLVAAPDGAVRIRRKEVRMIQHSIAGGYLPLV